MIFRFFSYFLWNEAISNLSSINSHSDFILMFGTITKNIFTTTYDRKATVRKVLVQFCFLSVPFTWTYWFTLFLSRYIFLVFGARAEGQMANCSLIRYLTNRQDRARFFFFLKSAFAQVHLIINIWHGHESHLRKQR